MKRILIAGIGNIFLGDDAFGVEVARALRSRHLPPEARVMDFGIRSYDLAFALTDGYDAAILVDATPRGEPPGTVYLIEPDLADPDGLNRPSSIDAHSMNPVGVLKMAMSLGNLPAQLYLIGCEPEELDSEDGRIGLSAAVEVAVPYALEMIEALIQKLLQSEVSVGVDVARV
jgi:hydrogenase maturation protease